MKKLVTYTSYSKEEGRGSAVFANSNTRMADYVKTVP